jgi:hypothetical protein
VRRLFEQVARRRPLLLVLEDAHWADPATGLLLRHLAPSLAATPNTCTSAKRTWSLLTPSLLLWQSSAACSCTGTSRLPDLALPRYGNCWTRWAAERSIRGS